MGWGSNKLPRLVIEKDEKLENVKGNDLSQKNDLASSIIEGTLSGSRQGGSQSLNANKKNFLISWTTSTFAQILSWESADHRHRKKQTSMHHFHYFKDINSTRNPVVPQNSTA